MTTRPPLVPWVRCVDRGDRLDLVGPEGALALSGPSLPLVRRVLDLAPPAGETGAPPGAPRGEPPDVPPEAPADVPPGALRAVVDVLADLGLLRVQGADGSPAVAPAVAASADLLVAGDHLVPSAHRRAWPPGAVAERLAAALVAVVGPVRSLRADCAGTLAELGVRTAVVPDGACVDAAGGAADLDGPTAFQGGRADLVVGVGTFDELAEVNHRCLDAGLPFLPVLPHDGATAHVGPLCLPGTTACLRCARDRRAEALPHGDTWLRAGTGVVAHPTVDRLVASVAALVVLRWIGLADPLVPGTAVVVRPLGPGADAHRVLRRPRCPACRPEAAVAAPYPWALGVTPAGEVPR